MSLPEVSRKCSGRIPSVIDSAGVGLDHRTATIRHRQPDTPGQGENATAVGRFHAAVEKVHSGAAQHRGHEAVGRPVIERLRIRYLLQAAVAHDGDPLAKGHRLAGVVRHVDHRRAEPLVQAADFVPELAAEGAVEARQRLVQEEVLGTADHRPPEGHALLLAQGKFARPAVQQGGDVQRQGRLVHPQADLVSGRPAQFQAEAQIAANGEVRIECPLLEDHGHVPLAWRQPLRRPAADGDLSSAGLLQPGDQAEGRRLAAAGGSHENQ